MPKAIEDSLDNVPEELHSYYTERNGKFEFTGIEGLRTQADIDRLQSALQKERSDHGKVKEKFKLLGDLDIDEVRSKLDRFEELETLANGKLDETAIQKLVDARSKTLLGPVEREKQKLSEQLNELMGKVSTYEQKEKRRTISDSVLSIVTGSNAKVKLLPEALEDAMMFAERMLEIDEDGQVRTKDNVGVTPGLSPEVWLSEMLQKKPHWALTAGGGASGSGNGGGSGPNPWSKDGWNLTEQGRIVTSDPRKADQLAKSAGTRVGGPRPLK